MNVAAIGTGEYVTGFVETSIKSDKKVGVVALVLFDLRRKGKVGSISLTGTNGAKFSNVRRHFDENIAKVYNNLSCDFQSYPDCDVSNPEAYKDAIDALKPGSCVVIFTPDPTHFPIALYAIRHKMHVLITKPAVKTVQHHQDLVEEAAKNSVLVMVEHHKRFDPAYQSAKSKINSLGEFSYFYSLMTQPRTQLETFRSWAGKESDISYYLNSHHVDILCWFIEGFAKPTRVTASAAAGIAVEEYGCVANTEDTITLLVDWQSTRSDQHRGTAIFAASWTAPTRSGVHSAQGFHYAATQGDIHIDQAHRGYQTIVDGEGPSYVNPFYVQYAPDESGDLNASHGYGYISIEKFIDAATSIGQGKTKPSTYDERGLPTLKNTLLTTVILEAGRRSLDEKRSINIVGMPGSWELQ